ncbi:MAG: flavin reductase family protein [Dehalococcoidia bacterium]|nr:flavin reductase family protein [Dehalococcoidia bacterium]
MKLDSATMGRVELHDLIGTAMGPLPIVFVSTVGPDGTYNAAPFSFAAPICSKPAIICVSIGLRMGQKKDTIKNIEYSHDFVINSVDENIIKQTIQASADYPYGVDEIKATGLTAIKGDKVKSPRIAEARVSMECRLVQKLELMEEYKDAPGLRAIIFGEVVMAHVKDEVWVDGKLDPRRLKLIGRVGSNLYCKQGEIFELKPVKV